MGLGAASVKAQVRIGGNGAPNAAAVLDLNANDTNTGTKGIALPRVSLTNVTTPLTGTPTVNGMMVYNTNASTTGGSGVGMYYWTVDSSKWVKVINSDFTVPLSKIQTANSDSGKFLISDGKSWYAQYAYQYADTVRGITLTYQNLGPVTWTKVIEQDVALNFRENHYIVIPAPNVGSSDVCIAPAAQWIHIMPNASQGTMLITDMTNYHYSNTAFHITCYRPSI